MIILNLTTLLTISIFIITSLGLPKSSLDALTPETVFLKKKTVSREGFYSDNDEETLTPSDQLLQLTLEIYIHRDFDKVIMYLDKIFQILNNIDIKDPKKVEIFKKSDSQNNIWTFWRVLLDTVPNMPQLDSLEYDFDTFINQFNSLLANPKKLEQKFLAKSKEIKERILFKAKDSQEQSNKSLTPLTPTHYTQEDLLKQVFMEYADYTQRGGGSSHLKKIFFTVFFIRVKGKDELLKVSFKNSHFFSVNSKEVIIESFYQKFKEDTYLLFYTLNDNNDFIEKIIEAQGSGESHISYNKRKFFISKLEDPSPWLKVLEKTKSKTREILFYSPEIKDGNKDPLPKSLLPQDDQFEKDSVPSETLEAPVQKTSETDTPLVKPGVKETFEINSHLLRPKDTSEASSSLSQENLPSENTENLDQEKDHSTVFEDFWEKVLLPWFEQKYPRTIIENPSLFEYWISHNQSGQESKELSLFFKDFIENKKYPILKDYFKSKYDQNLKAIKDLNDTIAADEKSLKTLRDFVKENKRIQENLATVKSSKVQIPLLDQKLSKSKKSLKEHLKISFETFFERFKLAHETSIDKKISHWLQYQNHFTSYLSYLKTGKDKPSLSLDKHVSFLEYLCANDSPPISSLHFLKMIFECFSSYDAQGNLESQKKRLLVFLKHLSLIIQNEKLNYSETAFLLQKDLFDFKMKLFFKKKPFSSIDWQILHFIDQIIDPFNVTDFWTSNKVFFSIKNPLAKRNVSLSQQYKDLHKMSLKTILLFIKKIYIKLENHHVFQIFIIFNVDDFSKTDDFICAFLQLPKDSAYDEKFFNEILNYLFSFEETINPLPENTLLLEKDKKSQKSKISTKGNHSSPVEKKSQQSLSFYQTDNVYTEAQPSQNPLKTLSTEKKSQMTETDISLPLDQFFYDSHSPFLLLEESNFIDHPLFNLVFIKIFNVSSLETIDSYLDILFLLFDNNLLNKYCFIKLLLIIFKNIDKKKFFELLKDSYSEKNLYVENMLEEIFDLIKTEEASGDYMTLFFATFLFLASKNEVPYDLLIEKDFFSYLQKASFKSQKASLKYWCHFLSFSNKYNTKESIPSFFVMEFLFSISLPDLLSQNESAPLLGDTFIIESLIETFLFNCDLEKFNAARYTREKDIKTFVRNFECIFQFLSYRVTSEEPDPWLKYFLDLAFTVLEKYRSISSFELNKQIFDIALKILNESNESSPFYEDLLILILSFASDLTLQKDLDLSFKKDISAKVSPLLLTYFLKNDKAKIFNQPGHNLYLPLNEIILNDFLDESNPVEQFSPTYFLDNESFINTLYKLMHENLLCELSIHLKEKIFKKLNTLNPTESFNCFLENFLLHILHCKNTFSFNNAIYKKALSVFFKNFNKSLDISNYMFLFIYVEMLLYSSSFLEEQKLQQMSDLNHWDFLLEYTRRFEDTDSCKAFESKMMERIVISFEKDFLYRASKVEDLFSLYVISSYLAKSPFLKRNDLIEKILTHGFEIIKKNFSKMNPFQTAISLTFLNFYRRMPSTPEAFFSAHDLQGNLFHDFIVKRYLPTLIENFLNLKDKEIEEFLIVFILDFICLYYPTIYDSNSKSFLTQISISSLIDFLDKIFNLILFSDVDIELTNVFLSYLMKEFINYPDYKNIIKYYYDFFLEYKKIIISKIDYIINEDLFQGVLIFLDLFNKYFSSSNDLSYLDLLLKKCYTIDTPLNLDRNVKTFLHFHHITSSKLETSDPKIWLSYFWTYIKCHSQKITLNKFLINFKKIPLSIGSEPQENTLILQKQFIELLGLESNGLYEHDYIMNQSHLLLFIYLVFIEDYNSEKEIKMIQFLLKNLKYDYNEFKIKLSNEIKSYFIENLTFTFKDFLSFFIDHILNQENKDLIYQYKNETLNKLITSLEFFKSNKKRKIIEEWKSKRVSSSS